MSRRTERGLLVEGQEQAAIQRAGRGDGRSEMDRDVPVWVERSQEGADEVDLPEPISPVTKQMPRSLMREVEASHEFLKAWGGQHIRWWQWSW